MPLVLLLGLLFGCTTTRYTSEGKIPLYISSEPKNIKAFEIEGRHLFYWWGKIPEVSEIRLDELVAREGHMSAANLRVREYRTMRDWLQSLFSFGLYTPITYRINGFAREDEDFFEMKGDRRWAP